MATNVVRSQSAVAPDLVESAGTDNSATAPRVVLFRNPVRPCIVSVPATFNAAVRVKVNAVAANDFDNDADDDGPGYWTIAVGATEDVSIQGRISISRVSFVTADAADDLDDVSVVGWR